MKKNPEFDDDELNLVTLAQEYSDEGKARSLLESLRWPNGATCPHCARQGSECKDVYRLMPKRTSKRPCRAGLWKCGACRKQFTVRVGTIFESSHLPISKWLMAYFILCSAKKGISAHQLHRMLKVTYKTAWFLAHRIRHTMAANPAQPLAGMLGVTECDEVYVGPKTDTKHSQSSKVALCALIQRGGEARTAVFKSVTEKNVRQFIGANLHKDSVINTDEHAAYRGHLSDYKAHYTVNHSEKEYARKNPDGSVAHVNTCESFFSLLRRGIIGSFHHVSTHHLHRYGSEFEFRWNHRGITDGQRTEVAIERAEGKRLTYREVV